MDSEAKILGYLQKYYKTLTPEHFDGSHVVDCFIKQTTQDENCDITYGASNVSSDGSINIPVYAKRKSEIPKKMLNEETQKFEDVNNREEEQDSYRIGLIFIDRKDVNVIQYQQIAFSKEEGRGIQKRNIIAVRGREFTGYIDNTTVDSTEYENGIKDKKNMRYTDLNNYFLIKYMDAMIQNHQDAMESQARN